MTTQELWQATLAQIQFQISPANFATWFKNTYILSRKEEQLIISVPNNFSKEWLENKYNKMVFRVLRSLDGEIKEVRYTADRSPLKEREGAPAISIPEKPLYSADAQLEFQELRVDRITNLSPRYTFENFVVGPFNELAHAAFLATVKNPGSVYNPLFVYGGVGLGKTHLLQAVGNQVLKALPQCKVRYMSSEKFTTGVVSAIRNRTVNAFRSLYRGVDVLIIDDVQFLAGKEKTQEELFHTFNTLYENGKQIIFSSDRPPKAIPALEERLRSRFEGGMIADIGPPDLETRMAILKTKVQESGFEMENTICEYIAANVQRNIRELEGALNRILAFRRLNNRAPDLKETKVLLRSVIQNLGKAVNPKKILQTVAEFYDLKEKELMASSRKKEVVRPRQVAMYLLREELKSSYPFIGERLGGKDHTTAIYACNKVAKEIEESDILADEITLIKQRIYSG